MSLIRYIKNQFRHDRNIKQLLNEQNLELRKITSALDEQRIQSFREKTLTVQDTGVSSEKICDEEVIVSLTSYGNRIHNVHLAIESIMQGTVKPNRIVLWLSEEEFKGKPLPRTLEMQIARGLQIEFYENLRSYLKLVPALKKFPEAAIVTIDDDVLYEFDFLERLANAHNAIPNTICACRMHRIKLNTQGQPLPYLEWQQCIDDDEQSILNFPTGVGGVLYPPQCLSNEVFNSDVFMNLCPKADDIWFYVMARLNRTSHKLVRTGQPDGYYMSLPLDPTSLCLYNTDATTNGNDVQFRNVIKVYGIGFGLQ